MCTIVRYEITRIIDLNTDNFLTDSEGNVVANPRYYRSIKNQLAKVQRTLARRASHAKKEHRPLRESQNYQKQRLVVIQKLQTDARTS